MVTMVNVDNFARAETARMLDSQAAIFGTGTNEWLHLRAPTDVGNQTVIRMNRDTLYSSVLLDISEGATLTMPDAGGRYMATMIVTEDHLINAVYNEPGTYELTIEEHETPFVAAIARTFMDPDDADDIARRTLCRTR